MKKKNDDAVLRNITVEGEKLNADLLKATGQYDSLVKKLSWKTLEDIEKVREARRFLSVRRGEFDMLNERLASMYNLEAGAPRAVECDRINVGDWGGLSAKIETGARSLDTEIVRLRTELNEKTQALHKESLEGQKTIEKVEKQAADIVELEKIVNSLKEKESLSYLLGRVGQQGKAKILDDPEFRTKFNDEAPCDAFVLSIDIRRSTELMLKARDPKLFAQFIIGLAGKLRQTVLDNFGVFDKFTGDGILGFFPDFYSGEDAGYYAVKAAIECHEIFANHYRGHQNSFISVLLDTGLGIGIDYGRVQLVEVAGDISVVGSPVVYACRMAGADAGETFINCPAHEMLFAKYNHLDFDMRELLIKHEGRTMAYSVRGNGKTCQAKLPSWCGGEVSSSCSSEEAEETQKKTDS